MGEYGSLGVALAHAFGGARNVLSGSLNRYMERGTCYSTWLDGGGCVIWLGKCDLGERLSSTHKHSFSIVSFPCFVWSNH